MKLTCVQRCSVASSRGRATCVVRAMPESQASRRAVLGASIVPALLYAPKAFALIPDEEDEELLERAKANRKARLAQDKATTQAFMKSEGLSNSKLNQDLIPVQKGVYELAKSGAQLEKGDLRGVASTLSGGWVDDLRRATGQVSGLASADAIFDGIASLKEAANKGDLAASKKQFVGLVGAVQTWATDAGVSASLKGL